VHTIIELLGDAEFWVAVAFVIFVAGLGYLGVHRMIAKSLDERAARNKAELDEARTL
jgi:F-type H+-transporting ATPase subunit b